MNRDVKTVLAVADTNTQWMDLEAIVAFCQSMQAHLSLLVLDVASPAPVSQYGRALAIQTGIDYEHGAQAVQAKLDELQEQLDTREVASDLTCAYLLPGEIDVIVAEHARYADLSVFLSRTKQAPVLYRHAIHGALLQSGKPILIVPDLSGSLQFKRPLIAWDGGLYSARAVHNSLGILQAASEVNAVIIDPPAGTLQPAENLQRYLNRHNVSTATHELKSNGRRVSDLLIEAVDMSNADAIIMGGYGHSRLREYIFGGTTERLLTDTPVPILMSH